MKTQRVELIDYLRLIAALGVILFHYTFNGIDNGKITSITQIPELTQFTKFGYLGVELFFMISGYVIFFSAKNKSFSRFISTRALRLYPAYWAGLVITSLFIVMVGGHHMPISLKAFLANLTMLQSFVGIYNIDGVYWTLAYELTFYFFISLCLLLGLKSRLEMAIIVWALAIIACALAGNASLPIFQGYYSYFVAGALFAVIKETAGKMKGLVILLAVAMYVICCLVSLENAAKAEIIRSVEYPPAVINTFVSLFFLAFIAADYSRLGKLSLPGSAFAGAITYPLYLVHAHIGYMLIDKFASEENKIGVYALVIGFVMLLAWLIHQLVEKRMAETWKAFFRYTIELPVATFHRLVFMPVMRRFQPKSSV
ncbi:acyltransferase family protein [Mixta calida]|uniref:acyltransferase family protein n=2 Tax=Mixta calida TaxID=665913 RepID=UPI0028B12C07|nr:acyltransferase [Mixta calida]